MIKRGTYEKDSVTLREYMDGRFDELKQYIDLKFNNIEKSTCLAQDNLNIRLEKMNEFRSTMSDQSKNFVTRNEHDSLISKYDSDIRVLREQNARNEGKANMQSVYVSYAIATIGIIIGVVSLIFK